MGLPGGGAGSGGGETPPTAKAYCEAFDVIIADYFHRCLGYSAAGAKTIADGDCDAFAASAADGRIKYDAAQAAKCLAGLPAYESCAGEPEVPYPDACDKVTVGTLALGASCDDGQIGFTPGQSCATTKEAPAYCRDLPITCGGVCTAYLALGAECDSNGQGVDCDPSTSWCNPATGQCSAFTPGAKGGESCADASCDYGLYCDEAAMVCRIIKPLGAACQTATECGDYRACGGEGGLKCIMRKEPGQVCTPGAGECSADAFCGIDGKCTTTGAAVGAPCGDVAGSDYVGCEDGVCRTVEGDPHGTCIAIVHKNVGDACDPDSFEETCDGKGATCDRATMKCIACP